MEEAQQIMRSSIWGVWTAVFSGGTGRSLLRLGILLFALIGVGFVIFSVVVRVSKALKGPKGKRTPECPADDSAGLLCYEAMAREGDRFLAQAGEAGCHALLVIELADAQGLQERLGPYSRELFARVARMLQRLACSGDLLGYESPGSYALLLKNMDTVDLVTVKAADISDTLRFTVHHGGQEVPVSCHIGISLSVKDAARTFGQLMREAEVALARGGEREYTYYDEPVGAELIDEGTIRGRLQDDHSVYGENRQLRNFLRHLDGYVVVWQVGRDIRPLYVSAGACSHVPALAAGKPLEQLALADEVSGEDLPMVSAMLRLCAAQDQMQDLTYRTPSGAWRRAQLSKVCGKGAGEMVLALTEDASRRHHQDLHIANQRQRRQALFRVIQLTTFEVDLTSRSISFSAREEGGREELFSQKSFPEDLIGTGLIAPDSVETLRQFAAKLFQGDLEGTADIEIWDEESGERKPVRISYHMVLNDHGQGVKGVGMSEVVGQSGSGGYDQNAVLKMQLKMQEKYYRYAQKYQTELRKYRHDRRNTFIALSAMVENKDIPGIRKYVNKLGEDIQAAATVISTQNPALDALLSDKFAQAKAVGIQVKHMIGLEPDTGIDSVDFCIVMGCSLDNAIEACQRVMESGEDAFIELHLIERRGVVVCQMRNSSHSKAENGVFRTTKTDTANHGFGLKNMETIVHKYGGLLSLKQDEGIFMTEFTLFTQ